MVLVCCTIGILGRAICHRSTGILRRTIGSLRWLSVGLRCWPGGLGLLGF